MILLVTFSEDFYTIDKVEEYLHKQGVPAMRLNTDMFPSEYHLTVSIDNKIKSIEYKDRKMRLNVADIQTVWLRKFWNPKISEEVEPAYRSSCMRESREVLEILMHSLEHLPAIDPFDTVVKAGRKFPQLEMGRELGIRIPRTLITNEPQELRAFYKNVNGKVAAKLLTPLSVSMQATDFFLYTSLVTEEHLEDADMLKYAPMTFQEYIEKEYELRIIYVDGNFYTGKIDASGSKRGKVDWRISQPGEVKWSEYELPQKVKGDLTKLMNKLGLAYGAIDMIKSVSGEYVFLEVNPSGEWGMLQKDLGLPIAEAIGDALIKRTKR